MAALTAIGKERTRRTRAIGGSSYDEAFFKPLLPLLLESSQARGWEGACFLEEHIWFSGRAVSLRWNHDKWVSALCWWSLTLPGEQPGLVPSPLGSAVVFTRLPGI